MSKEEAEEYVVMLEKYHSAGWDIIYKEGCESLVLKKKINRLL